MSEKSDKKTIIELTGRVDELTEVLSALISDIDYHRMVNAHSCYWWKGDFLKDIEVSDELKEKLGLRPNKDYDEDEE